MEPSTEYIGKNCIKRVLKGNQEAFRDFIDLYKNLVFSIASKLITVRQDRDDVCQEVFLKVYQNLNRFRGECKISTWIGKITYNICINRIRKKKELCFEVREQSESVVLKTDSDERIDIAIENQDLSERLQAEIKRLPEEYRMTLTLFHMQDFKYDEIAQIMNLPEGTIKSHLFRARQLLKKQLLEKYKKEELLQ